MILKYDNDIDKVYKKVWQDLADLHLGFTTQFSTIVEAKKNYSETEQKSIEKINNFIIKKLLPQVKKTLDQLVINYNGIESNDENTFVLACADYEFKLNECEEQLIRKFGEICIFHPQIKVLFDQKKEFIKAAAEIKINDIKNSKSLQVAENPSELNLPISEIHKFSPQIQRAIELLKVYEASSPPKEHFRTQLIAYLVLLHPLKDESFKSYVKRCINDVEIAEREKVIGWKFGAPANSTLFKLVEAIKGFNGTNPIYSSQQNFDLTHFKPRRNSLELHLAYIACKNEACALVGSYLTDPKTNTIHRNPLKNKFAEIKKKFAHALIAALEKNLKDAIKNNQPFCNYVENCIAQAELGNPGWSAGQPLESTLYNAVKAIRALDPMKKEVKTIQKGPQELF